MWNLAVTDKARKTLDKLPKSQARHILNRLEERVLMQDDPTLYAKSLKRDMLGLWLLRIENYRVVFRIIEATKTIHVTHLGHRKDVYN